MCWEDGWGSVLIKEVWGVVWLVGWTGVALELRDVQLAFDVGKTVNS